MNRINDQEERDLAINPFQSFIVAAPAGSGKTGLITQRVLKLLSTVQYPEEILAITFTRKAAAEMAGRVHHALENASNVPRPSNVYEAKIWDLARHVLERDKELGWNLQEIPNRLRIKTIDSFSRFIASQFALETEFGDIADPCSNPETHYLAASHNLIQKLENDEILASHLSLLLKHIGNDLERCSQLLADLLGKREHWLPLIFGIDEGSLYFQHVIEEIVEENLISLNQFLLPIAAELGELVNFATSHAIQEQDADFHVIKDMASLPGTEASNLGQWKIILKFLVTKTGKVRKKLTARDGFPSDRPTQKERMKNILSWCECQTDLLLRIETVNNLPSMTNNIQQQALLEALSYLLPRLAAELDIEFKAQDTCDYSSITLAALQALNLKEDSTWSDTMLRMDYQIKHILVDEFQDTSSTQLNLIKSIVDNWQPDEDRTLFLVGDAMQSLYSFRNANVGLFLNSQRHPIGQIHCKPLTLSTNFRSDKVIIDWVNSAFSESFPSQPDITRGAVTYSPSSSFKQGTKDAIVDFIGFTGNDSDSEEARQIGSRCRKIISRNKEETIAIMVRSRNHLKYIIPELRRQGLSWEAQEITKLSQKMPVLDLMSITRAFLSPADRIAWLAILRAPFCGLGLHDILVISNSTDDKSYFGGVVLDQLLNILESPASENLSEYGFNVLKRVIPIIKAAWSDRGRQTLRKAVESTWYELGGPATISDESEKSDIRRFFDLLESHQANSTIKDWRQFEVVADELFASPMSIDSATQYSGTKIQIMTIHKSKGLEFDHVFLPGLASRSASDKKSLMQWQMRIDEKNQESLLVAPLGAHGDDDDPIYKYLSYEQSLRSQLEKTRIMYVAATRAIKGLYLYAKLRPGKKDDITPPSKSSLLWTIWNPIERQIKAGKYAVMKTEKSDLVLSMDGPKLTHIRRLPADFKAKKPPTNSLMTNSPSAVKQVSESVPSEELSLRASQLGTLFHRTLKQLANEGLDAWPDHRRQKLPLVWQAQLREFGIVGTPTELNELQTALALMLSDSSGQWVLSSHPQAYSEKSISYSKPDGSFGTSVIDRTFVTDGIRWVIDYKLSKPGQDESFEEFKERQVSRYTNQLTHYAYLCSQMGPEPVKCALYFPKLGSLVRVSIN